MNVRANANALPFRTGCAQTMVGSPPYFGQRVYGDSPDERGLETLENYCRAIVHDMRQVWDVLTDTGTAWLVIGDTAAGSGGAGGDHNPSGSKASMRKYRQGKPVITLPKEIVAPDLFSPVSVDGWHQHRTTLRTGNWCMVPHHVAMHLQADGWFLRKEIVWEKGTAKPEDSSHTRRPGWSHETILFLSKSMDYRFNPDAIPKQRITDPATLAALPPGSFVTIDRADLGRVKGVAPAHLHDGLWYGTDGFGNAVAETSEALAKYPKGVLLSQNDQGSVWHISPGRDSNDDHPAVYPDALAERCIAMSTNPGDVVLDPWYGSGTTADAAHRLGRIGIGSDLYAGMTG